MQPLNSSSHVQTAVGEAVMFVAWKWVQPPNEVSALAQLRQHRGAWQAGWHPQREGKRKVQRCGRLGRERCHDSGAPQGQGRLRECVDTRQGR